MVFKPSTRGGGSCAVSWCLALGGEEKDGIGGAGAGWVFGGFWGEKRKGTHMQDMKEDLTDWKSTRI